MNEKDTITTTDKKEITTTKPPQEPAANYTPELSRAEHEAIDFFLCFCRETGLISEEFKKSLSGAPKHNPDPEKWYLFNDSIRSISFVFPTLKEAIQLHNLIKSVKNGKAAEKTLHEIMYR